MYKKYKDGKIKTKEEFKCELNELMKEKRVENKMRNKKIIAILTGAVLLISMCVAGCSGENNSSEQTDKVQEETKEDEGGQEAVLESFEAETLEGGTYTQDDLKKKDVTVMNFWSVMCGPCIAEMPDIAEFAKSLPDNIELLTVCLDGSSDTEFAEHILEEAGYSGTTLLAGTGDFKKICDAIQYTPTTIVIDQNGNMIGEALIGGQEDLEKVYTEMINNALKEMGKAEIGDGKK